MMRTITVRGVGNVSAKPDYITISMTIESIRKDYDGAMKDASERISKLQDVAVSSGDTKEDLKTTSFNVMRISAGTLQRSSGNTHCNNV